MLTLLIETSTERCLVALANLASGELLGHQRLPYGYTSSTDLLPSIAHLFDVAGRSPQQLEAVAVGIGPGSYTGMRVGVAAAKGIAFARSLPLLGIPSLYCFAPPQPGRFAVAIDAKIGGIYFAVGELRNETCTFETAPAVLPLEDVACRYRDLSQWISPNSGSLRDKCTALGFHGAWHDCYPDPKQFIHQSQHALQQHQLYDTETLPLLYLREGVTAKIV